MKKVFGILLPMVLGAGIAAAQDMPASAAQDQSARSTTQSSTSQSTVIRGCLSGSASNYTLTDQNGMQYRVTGDEAGLAGGGGPEGEINGTENQSTETASQGGDSMAHVSNSVQASSVRDISSRCRMGA